jgi:hypothetical protein
LEAVSKLALEYAWSKEEILTQVYPSEVGPLLTAAYQRRAELNLDRLSIACAPYAEESHRQRLFEFWKGTAVPKVKEVAKPFNPMEVFGKPMGGVGMSPDMLRKIQEMQCEKTSP